MFRGIVRAGVALGVLLWLLVIVSLFVAPTGTSHASKTTSAATVARRDLPRPAPVIVSQADVEALRARQLMFPVPGFDRLKLHDSFEDPRDGGSRIHAALDIAAPRGTPVLAVEDGMIARLHNSVGSGGLSVYHFDASATYCYYYAHLDRYAPGLKDGAAIKKGDVVGFVGTTGNAPPSAPHLHFAVFKLGPEKRWGHGVPLNPYELWSAKRAEG
jgi:murein DD-endopeptidase MepM/ murein hydrolase activator NlpD